MKQLACWGLSRHAEIRRDSTVEVHHSTSTLNIFFFSFLLGFVSISLRVSHAGILDIILNRNVVRVEIHLSQDPSCFNYQICKRVRPDFAAYLLRSGSFLRSVTGLDLGVLGRNTPAVLCCACIRGRLLRCVLFISWSFALFWVLDSVKFDKLPKLDMNCSMIIR